MRHERFADRADAGQMLAEAVTKLLAGDDRPVVVLGLPRGGVPVAAPVAHRLGATLDVVVVRKLGLPWQPELAMGAIAAVGGHEHVVRNEDVVERAAIDEELFGRVLQAERAALAARALDLRGASPHVDLAGRVAVLVDDGLATGATMRAAVAAVRAAGAARVVVAVPVGSPEACALLRAVADDVVCLIAPRTFHAVGQAYRDFGQTSDGTVRELLEHG